MFNIVEIAKNGKIYKIVETSPNLKELENKLYNLAKTNKNCMMILTNEEIEIFNN